jgi:hypothetical protein
MRLPEWSVAEYESKLNEQKGVRVEMLLCGPFVY